MQHHFQNLFGFKSDDQISFDLPETRRLNPVGLRADIDAANLSEMWNMILTLDYAVQDVSDLPPEKQEEFLNVMSLLLTAFNR
ncbi:hypothetical protein [Roseibium alexandrii]|jgi:hypothetical protein|uniref:Uncharacterized protein n=1 Tax=Roseibium alexandrii (strain DSM 17067 / NCIMB 14079 / DFL-11) TaxID=244592 RepID=A0A5E8GWV1_ROSAD|nr:hypothetical protein [Roseibium alexandrii]EEE44470.1 hypothetical protein SADFL11_1758 [Roseibium alexandrii DFL-11]